MLFPKIALPKKIDPCPILESIIEIRFSTLLPPDAVFGVVYQKLKDTYPTVKNLPIRQLPSEVLQSDPELQFKPHYRLKGTGPCFVHVGPRVLSLMTSAPYPGWSEVSARFIEVVALLKSAAIVSEVSRFAARYVNFFKGDVFDQITLKTTVGEDAFQSSEKTIRAIVKVENYSNILQISNHAVWTKKGIRETGSVIDIDTYIDKDLSLENILETHLTAAHAVEKQIFFNLLKPETLKSFNPEY